MVADYYSQIEITIF